MALFDIISRWSAYIGFSHHENHAESLKAANAALENPAAWPGMSVHEGISHVIARRLEGVKMGEAREQLALIAPHAARKIAEQASQLTAESAEFEAVLMEKITANPDAVSGVFGSLPTTAAREKWREDVADGMPEFRRKEYGAMRQALDNSEQHLEANRAKLEWANHLHGFGSTAALEAQAALGDLSAWRDAAVRVTKEAQDELSAQQIAEADAERTRRIAAARKANEQAAAEAAEARRKLAEAKAPPAPEAIVMDADGLHVTPPQPDAE